MSDVWRPLGFFSRHLSSAEERYATYDKEMLACFAAVQHWRHLLDGVSFQLRCDHLPVVQSMMKKTEAANPRQARQLSALLECDSSMFRGRRTMWRTGCRAPLWRWCRLQRAKRLRGRSSWRPRRRVLRRRSWLTLLVSLSDRLLTVFWRTVRVGDGGLWCLGRCGNESWEQFTAFITQEDVLPGDWREEVTCGRPWREMWACS